jgi:hypothetical protein
MLYPVPDTTLFGEPLERFLENSRTADCVNQTENAER